jgi:hypothetical protein
VEDTELTVDELKQCIAAANGNKGKINQCKKDFTDEGGTASPQEGGKVFTDGLGGKVFVTEEGGKVFG